LFCRLQAVHEKGHKVVPCSADTSAWKNRQFVAERHFYCMCFPAVYQGMEIQRAGAIQLRVFESAAIT